MKITVKRIARSIGRARIETRWLGSRARDRAGIARSIGRARIETHERRRWVRSTVVSPDQLVGRGLKPSRYCSCDFVTLYRPINWSGAD